MSLPLIGVTMGDPTGVGPEIIVKALAKEEPFQACRPLVFGDQGVLLKTIKDLGMDVTVEVFDRVPERRLQTPKYLPFPLKSSPCRSAPDRKTRQGVRGSHGEFDSPGSPVGHAGPDRCRDHLPD